MPTLALLLKPLSIVQGTHFKLSSALFTVGSADYSMNISVLGGSLYQNGIELGASGSFTLAELKLGKITFLADGSSVPSFYFQASAIGFASSAEVQPILSYKAVNQAPVLSLPGLGSDEESLLNGGTIVITREMIDAADVETPGAGNLQFKITKVKGGSFLLNGFAAKSFSVADIEAGSVSFKHDGKFLAPSLSLSVSDSDGKASAIKSSNFATVFFDGSQTAGAQVLDPHEIAVKGPIAITEGETLKLTAKNLPIAVSTDVVPLLQQPRLELRIDTADHCTVMISGSAVDFFTLAQLKAGLVSIKHDGSQHAPSLNLSLYNGDVELDSLQLPFVFKTTNDLPTLTLPYLVLNPGQSQLLNRDHFQANDEETPETLEAAFRFTVKSAKGIEFHREDFAPQIKSFSLADVVNGHIRVTRLSDFKGVPNYSLTVTDPTGKTSITAYGQILPNHAPTGDLNIVGDFIEGQTLSISNAISDSDGLGIFTFTWLDSEQNAIEMGDSLKLTQNHVGKQIKVRITYVDEKGTTESIYSNLSTEIANINNAPTGAVSISGLLLQGETLFASHTLADHDGLGNITYRWMADEKEFGTGSSILLTQDQVGKKIYLIASYTDGCLNKESVFSAETLLVSNTNDSPSGNVNILGSKIQGELLRVSSDIADLDGLGVIRYTWLNGEGSILGFDQSLLLSENHVGKKISVTASYVDGFGNQENIISDYTYYILNVNDMPTGSVVISGIAIQGEILTAKNNLNDADGLGLVTYRWKDAKTGIVIGAGENFLIAVEHAGKQISVEASYLDGHDTIERISSTPLTASLNGTTFGQFKVNTNKGNDKGFPSISKSENGNFVITWQSFEQDGSQNGIYAQEFLPSGIKSGSEIRINQLTNGSQSYPDIILLDNGNHVVTWQSSNKYAYDGDSIYATILSPNLELLSEFMVNTYVDEYMTAPNISTLADGGFIITWSSYDQDDQSGFGVYAQRYENNGSPLGHEFRVNTHVYDSQAGGQVSSLNNGGFVVVWQSRFQDGISRSIYAQIFDSESNHVGGEFKVNTTTNSFQFSPEICVLQDGSFLVTWQSTDDFHDSSNQIYYKKYNPNGVQIGEEHKIINSSLNDTSPSIAALSDGKYVLVWTSYRNESRDITGQIFDSNDIAIGEKFTINTIISGDQIVPVVSALDDGAFVVSWMAQEPSSGTAWISQGPNSPEYGIYAQIYDSYGTKLNNNITWNCITGQDYILCGSENDYITSINIDDIVFSGAGNDTFKIDNLSFSQIDAGEGFDTLIIPFDVDLIVFENKQLINIESININSKKLVLDSNSLVNITNSDKILMIEGDGVLELRDLWIQESASALNGYYTLRHADATLLVAVPINITYSSVIP